ncbi:hypothetical protein AcV7_002060 [Taiwanofungus camphoratus]|nr:hypothetical protein AcV7_002060 [Antrodia cinnamomea]
MYKCASRRNYFDSAWYTSEQNNVAQSYVASLRLNGFCSSSKCVLLSSGASYCNSLSCLAEYFQHGSCSGSC